MSDISFESIIAGKQYELEDKLDIGHGLLSKLVDYSVITRHHRTAIEVSFNLNLVLFIQNYNRFKLTDMDRA